MPLGYDPDADAISKNEINAETVTPDELPAYLQLCPCGEIVGNPPDIDDLADHHQHLLDANRINADTPTTDRASYPSIRYE